MDFSRIFDNITEYWPAKMVAAGVIAAVGHHATLLFLFCLLVCLDTATRWMAIAYAYTGRRGLLEAIKGIPGAHRAGLISSAEMRRGFCEKVISYIILVVGASIVDKETAAPVFCNMVVSYLSATELLSIIENLNEAGVSCLTGLLDVIKRRAGISPKPPERK